MTTIHINKRAFLTNPWHGDSGLDCRRPVSTGASDAVPFKKKNLLSFCFCSAPRRFTPVLHRQSSPSRLLATQPFMNANEMKYIIYQSKGHPSLQGKAFKACPVPAVWQLPATPPHNGTAAWKTDTKFLLTTTLNCLAVIK